MRWDEAAREFARGAKRLITHGETPTITAWELSLSARGPITSSQFLGSLLDTAEAEGALEAFALLPGPWQEARTRDDKIRVMGQFGQAEQQGWHHQLYAACQQQYGDSGLSSNIAVPSVVVHSPAVKTLEDLQQTPGSKADRMCLAARVILAEPADSERISRLHTKKEANFGGMFDSIISTSDNEHWRAQRRHLAEAFLPLSSLARILPVSLARAKKCAERLGDLSAGAAPVDMSDFLLHEAQAQLQLALLGAPESFMEATNADIRRTFALDPAAEVGPLSEAMKWLLEAARKEESFRLPSDGDGAVRGPLTRALQTGGFRPSTDYGNMLLILFAGHDTTGHTMTWLMFELARNPEIQWELQAEVDGFFEGLGGRDPEYRDLGRLAFLDRCITETLRLWPAVTNGTFRQLQFDDSVAGPGGAPVRLPKGTLVNINNWSRHRNPLLWGPDADEFNPRRAFEPSELAHVGRPLAARSPQSDRFSPFAHNPRSCLGKNFAQMEIRLIIPHLIRSFDFALAAPYDSLAGPALRATDTDPQRFRGVNRTGTMGPMNLEYGGAVTPGERYMNGLKLTVAPRRAA